MTLGSDQRVCAAEIGYNLNSGLRPNLSHFISLNERLIQQVYRRRYESRCSSKPKLH